MDEAKLRWNKLKAKLKELQELNAVENTGDAPICLEKLQKSIEDDGKSKITPIKNTQHLKIKVNSLKTETNKQTFNNHYALQSKINSHNNVLKSEVNNRCVKNVNLSNTNDIEPLKIEMEKMYNYMEQLNDKLKTVTAELSNEKSSIVLMNSATAALALDNLVYQNLELEQKIREGFSYKEKLDTATMELENVIIEKNDLLKRLEESEVALASANEKIQVLSERSDDFEYAEKIKEIEDERLGWNAYQLQLENQISENNKALSRKEEYINHQEYMIENLTQEKQNLEIRLNKPVLELKYHQSEEIENYQNKIKQLSETISDTKNLLVTNKKSHEIEVSEMRDRIRELEKLVGTKTDLIHQQNMTLNLMREITPATNDNLIMKRRWP
ncbi:protein hook homolog [Myzus persicae]|uniref:protein hook homolog n=1 Tax=Myzus persicae TaxID=13164 RepID=UPI000B934780|nr:protein hook homolog [Myzus persicae]